MGVMFVAEYWVFESSFLVDRPSDCLYVRTIPLSNAWTDDPVRGPTLNHYHVHTVYINKTS